MVNEFNLEILSPHRVLYSGVVQAVTLAAYDGQTGILPAHGDFVGLLGTGVLQAQTLSGRKNFVVSGGLFSVKNKNLTVFAETSETIEEINLSQAQAIIKQIEENFADFAHYRPESYQQLQADLALNNARIKACS